MNQVIGDLIIEIVQHGEYIIANNRIIIQDIYS